MKNLKLILQLVFVALTLWLPGVALANEPAPTGFQVFSGPAQSILEWNPSTGAASYNIQRSSTSGGPYTLLGNTTSITYTDGAVTNGAAYYYVVSAVSNSVAGANSAQGAAIPLAAGYYAFINSYSGLALAGSNSLAIQEPYTGTNQIWQLVSDGGQYFDIKNPTNNAVLAAPNTSAQLTVSTSFENNNTWEFQVTNGSSYLVINTGNGQVMDNFGPSTTSGTVVGDFTFDGGLNQNWFITLPTPPALSNVTLTNSGAAGIYTFAGQLNTSNLDTTVICNLGTNTSYGVSVTNIFPASLTPANFSFAVTDAVYNATLHGLVTAQNAGGSVSSGDLTVGANIGSPQFQSAMVTSDGQVPQANVSAQINPNNLPTTVIIQFGTNTAYGQSASDTLAASASYQSLSQTFSYPSLNVATTLHALITASNAAGCVTSGDLTNSSLLFQKVFSSDFNSTSSTNLSFLLPLTGSAAWGDFDNDGYLDLVVEGQQNYLAAMGNFYLNPGTNQAPWNRVECASSGNRAAIGVGDFNNDNLPDVFLACGPEYNEGGLVQPSQAGFWSFHSSIAFGQNGAASKFLGSAVNLAFTNLTVEDANIVVGDFDHTGRQDALISGDFGGGFSLMYQNNLSWQFATLPDGYIYPTNNAMKTINASLPGLGGTGPPLISSGQSALVAGDFDNDGFLDIFALDYFIDPTLMQYAGFFHGDGNLNFIPTTNRFQLFPGASGTQSVYVETASCVLADMNGDGNLDMVLSYGNQVDTAEQIDYTTVGIWLNDGHGNLTNSNIVLPQLGLANVAVGDIFNHGRNDILMVGFANQDYGLPPIETVVLRNDGNGVFTPIVLGYFGSIGETGHGLALADYDNDGRLDFAMTGDSNPLPSRVTDGSQYATFIPATHIFRNVMNIPTNGPAAAPPNLSTTVGDGTVMFHWGNATDDITPANLLTYNLRVGTNSLDTSVVSPLANVTNGWRKIVAPGNCGHTTNTLYRFSPGTYYWSVQAVDGGFKGGAWAPEQTFTITNPEPVVLTLGTAVFPSYLPTLIAGDNYGPELSLESSLGADVNELVAAAAPNPLLNASWPIRFQGYTFQQSSSLNGPWTANTNIGTMNGSWSVLVTNSGTGDMFFRLVQ